MLLTRQLKPLGVQLKPLGVSTWKQPMPFANRIKNRYLLPGYYPFKPLFLIWRMGNQAGDLFVQRFINVNFKLILDYREVGKPADTNRLFSWSAAIPEKKISQSWLTLTNILPEHLYQQKDYRGQGDHPYIRKAYQYGLARLINSIPAYTPGSDTTELIPLWPRRLNSSGRNVNLYNLPKSKPERSRQQVTEVLARKELWEQFEKELSGGYREETIKSDNNLASSIKSNLPGENSSIKNRRYKLGLTSKADGEKGRPLSASTLRSSAMTIMRKPALSKGVYSSAMPGRTEGERGRPSSAGTLRSTAMIIIRKPVLPKGTYSSAIPGRAEVPDQGWVRPGSIDRSNRNMYLIDSNSLHIGSQQVKRELLGQQTPGRWQGRFYSRKPGPFNLLQLPIRTDITPGTSDSFKYWPEGYLVGSYARTGNHVLPVTTSRFYYNHPGLKYIRFVDRVLPGVNQRNAGHSLYNLPKSESERSRHLVTEVLARKELWEQFEKELSGGYRQEIIKSGNNLASSIKSSLPGENLSIKHRRYRLGLASKADREKGRPSSASALRSSAMAIMRKAVLPKGAYSPAMSGRNGLPDQGWLKPGSIDHGNRNIYVVDSNSLQTGKQQLKRELLGQQTPGGWQGQFYSRKPAPFNLLQFPIRTDITNKSGNNRASSIKSNLPGENLSIKHRRYRLGFTPKADAERGRPSWASAPSTAMTIMRKPVLPKGAYSSAIPGRAEVPDQGWVKPGSISRGNRNIYVIDSNSLQIGNRQVKRELLGQQMPEGWQGQFFSRKPGPFNLLQLPLRTDITPGTLDSLKYRLEGYPVGSYARTGDHILSATTSGFNYEHPGLKHIRFLDRILPGVNQHNTGRNLYNLPKLKPERGRQLVTEVLARKELWDQFKKELSGGYRQGTINRTAVKDNRDDYKLGLPHTVVTKKGFSGNVTVLPAVKRIFEFMGSDILRSVSNQKPKRLAILFDRWLNHSLYQSSTSKIQSQAAILDNKKGPQAGLIQSTREANSPLTRADKSGLAFIMPHTSMIPYAGNKTTNYKQIQSHVSVPDLNYRRDTSPGKHSQSNFDAQIGTINEQKMEMTASRNSDLKANEIRMIADRVYREIEQRMKQERQRRGL